MLGAISSMRPCAHPRAANSRPTAAAAATGSPVITCKPEPNNAAALTPRQMDVLRLVARGLSNRDIAHALDLSEGTVKLHVTAILKALGVPNRTSAVIAAARMGLTEGESN